MKIALLADRSVQAEALSDSLSRAGMYCHTYHASRDLFQRIDHSGYDVLLIDHELADMPAVQAVRAVRAAWRGELPVMVLSDRRDEDSVVNTLQAGADDYMIRPLRARELVARLHALRRRTAARDPAPAPGPAVVIGPYTLDYLSHQVTFRGRRLQLTPKEFDLAALLFSGAGRVIPHAQVEHAIWGYGLPATSRALANLVSRLRRTLALHPGNGVVITVVYGQGYRLEETAAGVTRRARHRG
ncbi:response regulator transcription factor [Cupriavidus sp. 2TAF22]|uniref:response regulator transcription factor n=1 Tax=unclassified Cupriavidus TaxID=2640874 RepID=UPI003F8DF747